MKNLLILICLFSGLSLSAQNINWQKEQKNVAYINFGYNYALTTQIGFAHKANKKIWLKTDASLPMGTSILDDYKLRLGAQALILDRNTIKASVKVHAIARQQKTNYVKMNNFGSDMSLVLGIYKPKWHLAIESGADFSNAIYLKHSESFKKVYSEVQDGWFTNSGGNYFYGLQASKNLGLRTEISLKAGATNAFSDNQNALLPVYFQLGILRKIN